LIVDNRNLFPLQIDGSLIELDEPIET